MRKHADATMVRVNADVQEGDLVISVTDNGRGFDVDEVAGQGLGLQGMQERARLIGGTLVDHVRAVRRARPIELRTRCRPPRWRSPVPAPLAVSEEPTEDNPFGCGPRRRGAQTAPTEDRDEPASREGRGRHAAADPVTLRDARRPVRRRRGQRDRDGRRGAAWQRPARHARRRPCPRALRSPPGDRRGRRRAGRGGGDRGGCVRARARGPPRRHAPGHRPAGHERHPDARGAGAAPARDEDRDARR